MAVKKSDLYSRLWESCDRLRGGMDASQYKDYVLALLFLKYVSDRAGAPDSLLDVPAEASFAAVVALKNTKDIGEGINIVLGQLAEVNDLQGVIDAADFNDDTKLGRGQDMVERLTNLVAVFEDPDLDFSGNRADGDDLLGDAYEYLMRHFATESGKSKGQFYTPAEVSRVLASVIGLEGATSPSQTIHDPACGSGSLLLKALDRAKEATGLDLTAYGQEMDNSTAALARMNMFIHGAGTAEIWNDNTLSSPHFVDGPDQLKLHDFVVANPPFSAKAWTTGVNTKDDPYRRFKLGTPPAKNGDYAFLLHILACLKSAGTGGVILPHGVLFRGNVEAAIRRQLVERGYIKTIISLPQNLFYGTGIPACIIVLDKATAAARDGILMVDASSGFTKDGPKNRLRERDIHRIVDAVTARADVPGYARLVPISEIADPANDFNLNIARYVESDEVEDLQDLDAHLRGGIPIGDIEQLDSYWHHLPFLRGDLLREGDRDGYLELAVPPDEVDSAISGSDEIAAVRAVAASAFDGWWAQWRPKLAAAGPSTDPKALVRDLSESLLDICRPVPLVDEYAAYQSVREFWTATMSDDVYLVSDVGWEVAAKPSKLAPKSSRRVDFQAGKDKFFSELLPADLLTGGSLPSQREEVSGAQGDVDRLDAELAELAEEHGADEGLLVDVVNEKGKFTKAAIDERRAALRDVHAANAVPEAAALVQQQRTAVTAAEDAVGAFHRENGALLAAVSNRSGALVKSKLVAALKKETSGEDATPTYRDALNLLEALNSARTELKTAEGQLDESLAATPPPDDEFNDERELLDRVEQLMEDRAAVAARAKQADEALNLALAEAYERLSEDDVRDLVLDARWLPSLRSAVLAQVDAASSELAARLRVVAERYATPLPVLVERSVSLHGKVESHLRSMGYRWA